MARPPGKKPQRHPFPRTLYVRYLLGLVLDWIGDFWVYKATDWIAQPVWGSLLFAVFLIGGTFGLTLTGVWPGIGHGADLVTGKSDASWLYALLLGAIWLLGLLVPALITKSFREDNALSGLVMLRTVGLYSATEHYRLITQSIEKCEGGTIDVILGSGIYIAPLELIEDIYSEIKKLPLRNRRHLLSILAVLAMPSKFQMESINQSFERHLGRGGSVRFVLWSEELLLQRSNLLPKPLRRLYVKLIRETAGQIKAFKAKHPDQVHIRTTGVPTELRLVHCPQVLVAIQRIDLEDTELSLLKPMACFAHSEDPCRGLSYTYYRWLFSLLWRGLEPEQNVGRGGSQGRG